MSNKYLSGSEWRKWDLHVHTPASYLNNQFPRDKKGGPDWEVYVQSLEAIKDVSVLGATDYFSIEGYKQLLEYRKNGRLSNFDAIFPDVELRLDTFVVQEKSRDINFHVIFSDELDPEVIEKDFLQALTIECDGSVGGDSGKRQLHERTFVELGELIKKNNKDCAKDSPIVAAAKHVTVKLEQVRDILKRDPFRDKFVLVLSGSEWSEIDWKQAYLVKKNFLQSAHFLDTGSSDTVLWALGRKDLTPQQIKAEFGRLKPCIHGSDAHRIEDLCRPNESRFCWIKADPTFDGLLRVVSEPDGRVYIGERPPKLVAVENNRSKFIQALQVQPVERANPPYWFDDTLVLNSGLVAIIGRKGTGKSALTDILALLGTSHVDPKDYSFLKDDKFRKVGLAKRYQGLITWLDGTESAANLAANVDVATKPERVRYLPQVYVDRLCNEVGVSEKFQEEIDKVVFSYLPQSERQGTSSLRALIAKQTKAIDAELVTLRSRLRQQIDDLIGLEKKKEPSYRQLIANKLLERQKELEAIPTPTEVPKPATEPDKDTTERLVSFKKRIDQLSGQIDEAESRLSGINEKLTKVKNIRGHLRNLSKQVATFGDVVAEDLDALGLKLADILRFEVDDKKLKEVEDSSMTELKKVEEQLGRATIMGDRQSDAAEPSAGTVQSDSLIAMKAKAQQSLDEITGKLSGEQKAYEAFLASKAAVEERKKRILGTPGDRDLTTINSLGAELKYLDDGLDLNLKAKAEVIKKTNQDIFASVASKRDILEALYKPLRDFVEQEKELQARAQSILTFDVGIVCHKERLADRFLSFVDQGRDGTFQGKILGRSRLINILQGRRFGSQESVDKAISQILDALEYDRSVQGDKKTGIEKQLLTNVTKADLLTWLYGLDYLDVQYRVQYNGKDLNAAEFSPGERGAILLIFYLLVDKDNIPLIIDQPEENLDNESVFNLLVPYIKRAKETRQVIIVTHNPNLAVVCDAEQIICTAMNKSTNEIRYACGSIEEPTINQRIIDVLEGTMPAFRTREEAYQEEIV